MSSHKPALRLITCLIDKLIANQPTAWPDVLQSYNALLKDLATAKAVDLKATDGRAGPWDEERRARFAAALAAKKLAANTSTTIYMLLPRGELRTLTLGEVVGLVPLRAMTIKQRLTSQGGMLATRLTMSNSPVLLTHDRNLLDDPDAWFYSRHPNLEPGDGHTEAPSSRGLTAPTK